MSDTIKVACEHCDTCWRVPTTHAGATWKCRKCNQFMSIPLRGDAVLEKLDRACAASQETTEVARGLSYGIDELRKGIAAQDKNADQHAQQLAQRMDAVDLALKGLPASLTHRLDDIVNRLTVQAPTPTSAAQTDAGKPQEKVGQLLAEANRNLNDGQLTVALGQATEAVKLCQTHGLPAADAYCAKARCLHAIGLRPQAIEAISKAIDLSRPVGEYHFWRAVVYLEADEKEKAKADLIKAMLIDPDRFGGPGEDVSDNPSSGVWDGLWRLLGNAASSGVMLLIRKVLTGQVPIGTFISVQTLSLLVGEFIRVLGDGVGGLDTVNKPWYYVLLLAVIPGLCTLGTKVIGRTEQKRRLEKYREGTPELLGT